MMYATRHVMSLFSVSRETVRNWCFEFARHLSVTANPGDGRQRQFTEDDMRVFALIHELKEQKLLYEDVHAALDSGQRGTPPPIKANAIVASEQRTQIELLQAAIARLEADRDAVLAKVRPTEDENVRLKALLERSEQQLTDAQQEIRELYKQVARLEARRGDDD